MGFKEKEEDLEKSLTNGNKLRKRSTCSYRSKRPQKHETLSAILGVLTAVAILAIVAVIAIAVYEKNKTDESAEKIADCGPYIYPGINISELTPKITSQLKSCTIEGDCWTGEQCYECFKFDTWEVGTINDIPVCCPECEVSGLSLSNRSCTCQRSIR